MKLSPFTGRLANDGDELELRNNNRNSILSDSGELTGVFQQGFILSIISGTDLVVIASR
jgi:hypothetical protein